MADDANTTKGSGGASQAPVPPLTLTPSQQAQGWVVKTRGGMQVKVFDLRKIQHVRIAPAKG